MIKFKILQLDTKTDKTRGLRFFKYDIKNSYNCDLYKTVYDSELTFENDTTLGEVQNNISKVLDQIFYKFNMEIPEDFKGHSLSVSDIISIDGKYYFINPTGFIELKIKDFEFRF